MNENDLIQLITDWKAVARTEAGARVIKDLSRFCGENENPYVEGSFDLTAQKCGKLSVILYIRKKLAASDELRQTKTKTERIEENE